MSNVQKVLLSAVIVGAAFTKSTYSDHAAYPTLSRSRRLGGAGGELLEHPASGAPRGR